MTKREWAGDASHRLPKGKVEPYRLWFEYLKLALRYPNISVRNDVYAAWDNVAEAEFSEWWSSHWRTLFAVEAPTRVILSDMEFRKAISDPQYVVLRVSLSSTKKARSLEIEQALSKVRKSGVRKPLLKPMFAVSSKRSINYRTLRGMLKFLDLYIHYASDIEETVIAYLEWSQAWNDNVRQKKWNRPLVYQPSFLISFVKTIESKRRGENKGKYDILRNQAIKFVRRGKGVLKNVAEGRFPDAQ